MYNIDTTERQTNGQADRPERINTMTNTEIKKLYTKTKKAYEKRTGEKFTWVMNAKQQRLGTATVMTDYLMDYEEQLARCEKNLAEFDAKHWEPRKADYLKRAREEAWKNEHTPGWYFGRNDYYWQGVVTPEHLEQSRQDMLNMFTSSRDDTIERLAKRGTYAEQYKKAVKYAEEMIQSPEIQDFLKAIGGHAVLDIKEHGATDHSYSYSYTEVYVRFHYRATEE